MSGDLHFDVRRFEELDSTNSYLLDEARRGAPAGTVALADHQRAGRGRLGRQWESPPGSGLLCSVLLRPTLEPASLYLVTAALALAAVDACRDAAGVRSGIKWPNDLVVGEAKVAGVLAEADLTAAGGPVGSVAVVAGIGVNVTWPGPPGAGGTSLAEAAGRPVERDRLFDALLSALSPRVDALDSPRGRAGLAEELRGRCVTLGRDVRVELAGRTVIGRASGLTPDGHLLVDAASGTEEVAAGDVVHLRRNEGTGPDR